MTNNSALLSPKLHNYSYQHVQGVMLLNLNKLAGNLNLSHSEYRLMGTLIGLWNKKEGKAFPTIEYLSKLCKMGKATIIKSLNRLVETNLLVIVKTKGKRNNYYFSNLIFETNRGSTVKLQGSSACKTTHDNKQIKNKTDKNISSSKIINQKNDDDFTNKINLNEYKKVLTKLENWSFIKAKFVIKKQGLQKIKKLIEIVENKNPDNKGAYLRTLLNVSDQFISDSFKINSIASGQCVINQMLKYQYWKHIPSGKILKVLPDQGNHILIKYFKDENMIMFIENGFTDLLEKFQPVKH